MELRNIPHKISYRRVKFPRLEFTTGELLLILPFGHDHERLLAKYRGWIARKLKFVSECMRETGDKKLEARTNEDFRDLVLSLVGHAAGELGVTVSRVCIREMKTKWASISGRGILMVNSVLKYLPVDLVRYVVLHEMAHLVERRHNAEFWRIIRMRCENFEDRERDLFVYWFMINKKAGVGGKTLMASSS